MSRLSSACTRCEGSGLVPGPPSRYWRLRPDWIPCPDCTKKEKLEALGFERLKAMEIAPDTYGPQGEVKCEMQNGAAPLTRPAPGHGGRSSMPVSEDTLEQRLIALAGDYRARQEDSARKRGHTGLHAVLAVAYDNIVVDIERLLCDEEPLTPEQHASRRLKRGIRQ